MRCIAYDIEIDGSELALFLWEYSYSLILRQHITAGPTQCSFNPGPPKNFLINPTAPGITLGITCSDSTPELAKKATANLKLYVNHAKVQMRPIALVNPVNQDLVSGCSRKEGDFTRFLQSCFFAKVNKKVFGSNCDGLQHEERYLVDAILTGTGG